MLPPADPAHLSDRLRAYLVERGFRVLRAMACGGQGAIYAAEHVRTGIPVVVKMLIGTATRDPGMRQQLAREAEMLAALRHPHVVAILDFDVAFGQPYMVMERLEGETLQRRIEREEALPLEETVCITTQIASALVAAHDAGIVHCDLKPSNIFLQRAAGLTDFVKVIDFGVARRARDPRRHLRVDPERAGGSSLVGTPRYMAPEQASGGDVTRGTDQFALAVVAWEMVTGVSPFAGATISEVLDEIVHGETPRLHADYPWLFSDRVDAVLARGMARHERDRYPDVLAFASALAAAAREHGRRSIPPPPASALRLRRDGDPLSTTTMNAEDRELDVLDR